MPNASSERVNTEPERSVETEPSRAPQPNCRVVLSVARTGVSNGVEENVPLMVPSSARAKWGVDTEGLESNMAGPRDDPVVGWLRRSQLLDHPNSALLQLEVGYLAG